MSDRLMDAALSVLLIALYVVPLVGILLLLRWWKRRSQRRALAVQARAVAAALEVPGEETATEQPAEVPAGYRIDMSAVYGSWFMFAICVAVVLLAVGRWWGYIGHAVYAVFLLAVYWTAFSKLGYETERKKCESLGRSDYVRVNLLFFAAIPTLVWFALMVPLLLRQLGIVGRH